MGFLSWENRLEERSAALTDFTRDLSLAGARALCRAWNAYPNNVFAISPVTRGVMRSVCGNLSEPTPDVGGASVGNGLWEIPIQFDLVDSQGSRNTLTTTLRECNTQPWNGSISSIVFNVVQPVNNNQGTWWVELTGVPSGQSASTTVQIGSNSFSKFQTVDESTFAYRIENCNPVTVVLPDPITETIDVDIIDNINNTTVYSTPVTINIPTINNSVELGVTVDVGGVQIHYDVGGITFGGGGGEAPTGLPGGDGSGSGSSDIRNTFEGNEYTTIYPNFDSQDTEAPDDTTQDEITEGEREIDEKIRFVVVTIAQKPQGGRTQIYRDSPDTDYFAGYISFNIEINGKIAQELPIPVRKEYSLFPVPDHAIGYRVYSVNKATLKVQEFERII